MLRFSFGNDAHCTMMHIEQDAFKNKSTNKYYWLMISFILCKQSNKG